MMEYILQAYANHNLLDYEGGNEEFDYLIHPPEELMEKINNQNTTTFAPVAINLNISIENNDLQPLQ